MFEFPNDVGNYEDRRIARDDLTDDFYISTCRVSDGDHPYETAVAHPEYGGNGGMVIVEAYDTAVEATTGHEKWLKIMTADELPSELVDCQNSKISQFIPVEELTFPRAKAD